MRHGTLDKLDKVTEILSNEESMRYLSIKALRELLELCNKRVSLLFGFILVKIYFKWFHFVGEGAESADEEER